MLKLRVLDLGGVNQLEFLLSSLTVAYDCSPSLAPNPLGGSLDGLGVYGFSQSHSASPLASPPNWPTCQTLLPGPVISSLPFYSPHTPSTKPSPG